MTCMREAAGSEEEEDAPTSSTSSEKTNGATDNASSGYLYIFIGFLVLKRR